MATWTAWDVAAGLLIVAAVLVVALVAHAAWAVGVSQRREDD
jgi:hypothetical protein